MPKIQKKWIFLLTGIVLFLFVFAIVMTKYKRINDAFYPVFSSHFSDANGLEAFYRALDEANIEASRNYYSFSKEHYGESANILFVSPRYGIFGNDVDSLISLVVNGANLFFIPENNFDPLTDSVGMKKKPLFGHANFYEVNETGMTEIKAHPLTPHPKISKLKDIVFIGKEEEWMDWQDQINSNFGYAWAPTDFGAIPLLGIEGDIVGCKIPVGEGRVFLFSSPFFLTNRGLQKGQNAELAVTLMREMQATNPTPIQFAEYYQGFKRETDVGLLQDSRVRNGLLLCFLAFFAWVYGANGRIIRPLPILREKRRYIREYAESLAQFYRKRSGGQQALFTEVARRFYARLRQSLGLDPNALRDPRKIVDAGRKLWGNQAADRLALVLASLDRAKTDTSEQVSAAALIRRFSKDYKLDRHGN